jgi:hypothetical protein
LSNGSGTRREEACERLVGVGPPPCPPPLIPIGGFVPGSFTSKLADILGSFTGKLTTLFLVFSHAIILLRLRFFLEVPRIEELQDSDGSPRREEVGRRTLRDHGGFLLPFFYRARFQSFTSFWCSSTGFKETTTDEPPTTSRVEESNSARKVLPIDEAIPPEDII